ncbi:MAG TPA: DUF1579 family protein [Terriglobales bacterium]|nr:DUF1579 family protein [Terriglobales bacterium]
MRKVVLLGLLTAFALTAVYGQETAKKVTKPKKAAVTQAATPPTPKPSPEMQKLAKLFHGKWNATGKIHDEMWVKGGDEGSGTEITKSGPGGFTSISDAKMNFKKSGAMVGHGVLWYDDSKKSFQGLWCDNGGPTCSPMGDGKWDGDKLVFLGEMPMGPKPVPVRQTYSNFSDDGFDWSMEVRDGQGNWKPEMSVSYRRAEQKEAKN